MRCPKCKAEGVKGKMTVIVESELLKGGGLRPKGLTAGDLRKEWDAHQEKRIFCAACGAEFEYVDGLKLKV